jgi:glyoxylase-like metal-dependent hydrolase (beta-lactamase superfamily II)
MFGLVERVAAAAADVELWRLDCGEFLDLDRSISSDVFAYERGKWSPTNSCYLIRHEKKYMLWDTGLSLTASWEDSIGWKTAKGEPLVAQLSRIQIKPEQISIIGISHCHADHMGQALQFPHARLLMGKTDFDVVVSQKSVPVKVKLYDMSPWLAEGATVEPIEGDKDVFGDGSVVMLSTPGHTLGHHSLLVRLPKAGPIILSGDLWSMADQISSNNMSVFTMNRAEALASMDRVLKIASNLKAKIIIQHEKADVPKLPKFPSSAR